MIPGRHYSWPIMRKGKMVRDHMFHDVSELEGIRHFYSQMLIGDTADNIIGIDKIGKVKGPKIIAPFTEEKDMYDIVLGYYLQQDGHGGFDRFTMNADCLWIWRSLGISYTLRDCN